jgi:glycosyltransferase involved in cell wall biosynthesis
MKELISIIAPVYNEEKNIPLLVEKLQKILVGHNYEVILVNDGSRDKSWEVIRGYCALNPRLRAINFKKNFGQTAAINAGIQEASGDILILIDIDLENDPADIFALLAKLEEGFDVVSGWRKNRWHGKWLTRKLPSMTANRLISWVSGVRLHDYGCTLKAYRRSVIEDVRLYGEMHRFIPVYCSWWGGRVGEIEVNYQPRQFGKSNYGLFRTYKVILDLLLLKFLEKYMQKPIHFFGGAGILSFITGFICAGLAVLFKLMPSGHWLQKDFIQTPLPTVTVMFFIMGMLMVLIGVNSEMLMRTYYESQGRFPYTVRERLNFVEKQGFSVESK